MANNLTILPAQITKIKVLAGKVFGKDDTGYREMLAAQSGRAAVKSCKDLRGPEIDRVIKHLERCAGQGPGDGGRGGHGDTGKRAQPAAWRPGGSVLWATVSQLTYILELWEGVSRAPAEERAKALRNFLQTRFGVSAPEFLTLRKAPAVIEAMKNMKRGSGDGGKRGETGTSNH